MNAATTDETPVTRADERGSPCSRCEGYGKLFSEVTSRNTGPRCPHCQGRGVEPRRLGPHRDFIAITAPIVAELASELRKVGMEREEWRYARTPDAADRRAEITVRIKRLYREAHEAGLRVDDIAKLLGMSRQAFYVLIHGRRQKTR